VMYDLAFTQTRLLISVLPDMQIRPQTKNYLVGEALKTQYLQYIERSKMIIYPTIECVVRMCEKPNTVIARCGHLCLYVDEDTVADKAEEIAEKLKRKCPLCRGDIDGLIPLWQMAVI